MASANQRLTIKDLRHGRNGVDPPQAISDSQCVEAVNIDWFNASVARKRAGVAAVSLTGSPFTGTICAMHRHVPSTDDTAAEWWAVDDASPPNIGRLVGGTVWSAPTLKDVPTGNGWDVSFASFNGKLFIAYKSAVNRLHVWDPNLAVPSVRRCGLATPSGFASVANGGGVGTYATTPRYYRMRWTEQRSGVTVRRSEPNTGATGTGVVTPDGAHVNITITQATPPNEGETHWEVEASVDGVTYYNLSVPATPVATTTFADTLAVSSYTNGPLSDPSGTYTLQVSYRSLAADQGRILGFGSYTSTDSQNSVTYSALLGSLVICDDERVPTGNTQGLGENDSGPIAGLAGPIDGSFFALKYRQFWKITPTGTATSPYSFVKLSPTIGAVNMQSIVVGEDEVGKAALYWQSERGPYRWGTSGIEYLGKAVEDKTIGSNSGTSLNLAATHVVAHTRWYPTKRQVWFWVATGSSNDPDTILAFSVGRTAPFYGGYQAGGGLPDAWSIFTGGIATARCSCLFSNTIGATMSRDLKPYIGSTSAANTFGKCDTGTQDLGSSYQAYVITKAYNPWGDGLTGSVTGGQVIALASAGTFLQVTTIGDHGLSTPGTETVALTASSTETRVRKRIGSGVVLSSPEVVQVQIGDVAAVNTSWQLDAIVLTWLKGAEIAA